LFKKPKEILPPEHCSTVKDYEKSYWWSKKRTEILEDKECECEICHRRRWMFQPRKKVWKRNLRFAVHHITYENCPYEKREDYMILCSLCHTTCHDILRYKNISKLYQQLAEEVLLFFHYKGIDTFHGW